MILPLRLPLHTQKILCLLLATEIYYTFFKSLPWFGNISPLLKIVICCNIASNKRYFLLFLKWTTLHFLFKVFTFYWTLAITNVIISKMWHYAVIAVLSNLKIEILKRLFWINTAISSWYKNLANISISLISEKLCEIP